MRNLFFFIFFLSVLPVFSQKVQWEKPIQGGSESYSVDVDSENRIYFAGVTRGDTEQTAIFNEAPLPTSIEDGKRLSNLFIAKTDENYKKEWIKVIESSWVFGSYPHIKIDASDNLVVAGVYFDRFKVDSLDLVEVNHNPRGFIVKFNKQGKLLWFNTLTLDDWGLWVMALDIDKDNNIYIGGTFGGNLTFKNGDGPDTVISSNSTSGFFSKYDGDGQFIWANSIVNDNQLYINDLAVDDQQNLYLTGWVYGEASFGTKTINAYNSDVFIAKYDNNQKNEWVKNFGTRRNTILEAGFSIALDNKNENFYVTGSFMQTVDFGGIILAAEDKNIFLAKYTAEGDLNWVRNSGSWSGKASYREKGVKVIVDNQDFVYVAGDFSSTGFFGDSTIVAYGNDVSGNFKFDNFVAKYFKNGDFSWVIHAGSQYDDRINSIKKDYNNNIFVLGSTSRNANFGDFQLDAEYHSPGYIAKIKDITEENRPEIILKASVDTIDMTQEKDNSSFFNIRSNTDWSISSNQSWLSISPSSGIGNSTISLIAEKSEGIDRVATITILGSGARFQKVIVKQGGMLTGTKILESTDVKVFPNPVQNTLYINIKEQKGNLISLFDVSGRIIIHQQEFKRHLDVSGLEKGLYFAKIEVRGKMLVKKILKE